MALLVRTYLRLLERYPLRTQAASTGTLMATGDVIAQFAVERKKLVNWDIGRTGRFLAFGTLAVGPILRGWYLILERYGKASTPALTTLKRVTLDQTLFAPTFLAFFISAMTFWKTRSTEMAIDRVKQDYKAVLITNWKLWPAAQLVNFYFVPFQHRILVVNFVAVIWNTYLAWKTEQSPSTSVSETPRTSVSETPSTSVSEED